MRPSVCYSNFLFLLDPDAKVLQTTMASIADDGNNTTIQEFFCGHGINEFHQKIYFSAFNIVTCITAFLGNFVIINALEKVSSLHSPSKRLFQSLASTDLCVGLLTQPLYIYSTLMPPWPADSEGCFYTLTYSGFLLRVTGFAFCNVSLLTTTAISVDRLLALFMGIKYRRVVTLTRVHVFIVFSWLFAFSIGLPSYFYTLRGTISLSCIIALLCVVTSTICYMKIYLKLRIHRVTVHNQQNKLAGKGIPINVARYRKTVSNALWVQSTLFVCYLPYGILTVKYLFTGVDLKSDPAWHATLCLVFLNSSLNPFLYCWRMREARQAVKVLARKCWCFAN